jgi:diguanylate cyclase (GGDEF)-like protein
VNNPSRVNHFSVDLRRLTILIGAAIAFFGVSLLAIIAYAGWSANQTATEIERTLLENALNQSIARALNEQKSIAWWDDPVVKITDKVLDMEFTDANFGVFLTETYAHDEVYILNAKDQPIYAFGEAKTQDPSAFEKRRPELDALIDEIRNEDHSKLAARPDMLAESKGGYRVLVGVQVARWAGHIVSIDGRPAVVAGMTIVPNIDPTLLKGTPNLLLSITYIDEAFINDVGHSLLLPDLSLTPKAATGDGIVSEPFVGDDHIPVGYLNWSTRRPGQVLLTIILPLVAFAILGVGVLTAVMFRRLRRTSEELAKREAQARYEAKHDPLSGLPNRAQMVEKIETFLRNHGSKGAHRQAIAAYIDIDRFKDINDTLGHEAGDSLIKAVAARLQTRLRPSDFLSRFGGDEFAILCSPAGEDAGASLAERIAAAFSTPFNIQHQTIRVTASVGIASAPDNGTTADELMRHADIALYEAKSQGRDRAITFCREMAEKVEHRRSIEIDLRNALEAEKLRVHYQPTISCATGDIVGVEALLRWNHPVHGEMSPSDFIPIAENSGLLPALGEWVLDRAMRDSKRWPHLEVGVNLSPVQFRHVDLAATLRGLVAKHDVDPSRFVLEITEGVLLDATEHTHAILDAFRLMGFKTALDDFGTRYSSLSYLCNFSFDKIKIDRSFVGRLSGLDSSKTIVHSVVTLGRALGMDIVAEGIETEAEAEMMTRLGCTELQGFYFSKAVSADALAELLRTFPRQRFGQVASLRAI